MQQRALLARDRTCRFPGCGRSFYLKAHHIVYYEHGGPTELDNLVLLCQLHHTLIHKPGWSLRRDADGTLWFTAPDGRLFLPPRRPTPQRPPPPTATARHLRSAHGMGLERHPRRMAELTAQAIRVINRRWPEPGTKSSPASPRRVMYLSFELIASEAASAAARSAAPLNHVT